MKPFRTHGFSQIPRLRDIESEKSAGESELIRQHSSSQEDGTEREGGNIEDIERLLNETKKSLLASQTRSAELEREQAQGKFDLEDTQLRYSTVQKQVGFGFIIVAVSSLTWYSFLATKGRGIISRSPLNESIYRVAGGGAPFSRAVVQSLLGMS